MTHAYPTNNIFNCLLNESTYSISPDSRRKISHCIFCLFKFEDDPMRVINIIIYSVFLCIFITFFYYQLFSELNILKKSKDMKNIRTWTCLWTEN